MFGKLKTGWKALGMLSDLQALWHVKTKAGTPGNVWGHKRTWVLLGAAIGGIGALVSGDVGIFGWVKLNSEILILIVLAVVGLFKGMRDKVDAGTGDA